MVEENNFFLNFKKISSMVQKREVKKCSTQWAIKWKQSIYATLPCFKTWFLEWETTNLSHRQELKSQIHRISEKNGLKVPIVPENTSSQKYGPFRKNSLCDKVQGQTTCLYLNLGKNSGFPDPHLKQMICLCLLLLKMLICTCKWLVCTYVHMYLWEQI